MENVNTIQTINEPKHKWLAKGSKFAKKMIMGATATPSQNLCKPPK
jgi:hypothetical protein